MLHARGAGKMVAIHFYWALMLGVTHRELAELILIAGLYNGVDTLSDGMSTLRHVLSRLEQLARAHADPVEAAGQATLNPQLECEAVLAKLVQWFSPELTRVELEQLTGEVRRLEERLPAEEPSRPAGAFAAASLVRGEDS